MKLTPDYLEFAHESSFVSPVFGDVGGIQFHDEAAFVGAIGEAVPRLAVDAQGVREVFEFPHERTGEDIHRSDLVDLYFIDVRHRSPNFVEMCTKGTALSDFPRREG